MNFYLAFFFAFKFLLLQASPNRLWRPNLAEFNGDVFCDQATFFRPFLGSFLCLNFI
jgi:hypothetical protein